MCWARWCRVSLTPAWFTLTDVKNARGDVQGIHFAEAGAAVNEYPIARLAASANPAAAEASWRS